MSKGGANLVLQTSCYRTSVLLRVRITQYDCCSETFMSTGGRTCR